MVGLSAPGRLGWSPPLQFGALSPPQPVVTDAPLAEAVHLVLACASDAAAAPGSPGGSGYLVGHWAQAASQKRLAHASRKILDAADRARRHPPDESAFARAEQVLSDALALALHVAQSHGAPASTTGGYPVQQLHTILADELGLHNRGGPLATLGHGGGYGVGASAAASSSGAVVPAPPRQTLSFPFDLACARPRQSPAPMKPSPAPSAGSKWGAPLTPAPANPFGSFAAASASGGGAFGTPLLESMFASLTKHAGDAADGYVAEESGFVLRRRLAR